MEDAIKNSTDVLFNYGVLGVMAVLLIVAVFYLVRYINKIHQEYLSKSEKQSEEFMKRVDAFTEVTKQYAVNEATQTELIKEVKQLVMNLKKN